MTKPARAARPALVVPVALLLLGACAGKEAQIAPSPETTVDEAEVARVAAEVDRLLLRGIAACRALAENVHVRSFRADSEQPQRTLTVLRDLVTRAGAEHASLLDDAGVVVASTDPGAVGYDFSEQPFVRAAAAGQVAVFPSLGFIFGRKRVFFVVPRETGAAALRMDVTQLERPLARLPQPAALIYRERYEVATNRPEWTIDGFAGSGARAAAPVDPGEGPLLDMMDRLVPPIGDVLEREGRAYDVRRVPTVVADWQLILCTPRE